MSNYIQMWSDLGLDLKRPMTRFFLSSTASLRTPSSLRKTVRYGHKKIW